METVTVKTAEDNFAAAFKYALEKSSIKFGMVDFQGWQDDCDCASCRSQRIVFDYLFPGDGDLLVSAQPNNAVGAD